MMKRTRLPASRPSLEPHQIHRKARGAAIFSISKASICHENTSIEHKFSEFYLLKWNDSCDFSSSFSDD